MLRSRLLLFCSNQPAPRSGNISWKYMRQNPYRALRRSPSGNCPYCSGRHPCIQTSHPLSGPGVPGLSAYLQASASDGTRSSDRSTLEPLHILPAPPQCPVRIRGTRYRQTCVPAHALCPECSPFCRSANRMDQGKSHAFRDHVLPPQKNTVCGCLSSRKSALYFFRSDYHAEFPASSCS